MLTRWFERLTHQVSYGFAVAVFSVLGGQLAATLGLLFIVLVTDWMPGALPRLAGVILGGVVIATVIHYLLLGMLHRQGGWGESASLRRLNDAVVGDTLRPELRVDVLQDVRKTLEFLPFLNARLACGLSGTVVAVGVGVEVFTTGDWGRGMSVLLGGGMATLLYTIFSFLATELAAMGLLRQVRQELARRIAWEGTVSYSTLTMKLAFFVVLIAISLVVVGVPLLRPDGGRPDRALGLSILSLGIGAFMSVLIFYSIVQPLQEIRAAAAQLEGTDQAELFSGSFDREFTQVADRFYQAARQIVEYRTLLRELNQDLERKVEQRVGELARERNTLAVILNTMADGVVLTDLEGRLLRVNPAFAQNVPGTAETLIGRLLVDVFPLPKLDTLWRSALADPGCTCTADLVTEGQRVFRTSASVLRPESQLLGVVVVFRDITHDVEVDRMKTEFISTVSHELRTPLTSILGFAKLSHKALDRDVLPLLPEEDPRTQRMVPRIQENLDIIVSEAERLTRLINDVLDIAKMEAGRIEWHDQSIDLAAAIGQSAEEIRGLIEGKGVELRLDLEPGLPMLWADPDRIQQVVLNLLSNAFKFTVRGAITVTATRIPAGESVREWRAPELGGVLVRVSDTGIGIPPEALDKLFKRFQQVGDTLRDKPQGTGLGLAICREIVTHYHGEIWAESQPGQGSTFSLVLPAIEPAGNLVRRPLFSEIRRRVTDSLTAVQGVGRRVLIVDDEAHIRLLLTQELAPAGYQTLEASNGLEALTLARNERPDLILMDVMMPGLSGFDVTQLLKSDPVTATIPILILSILEDRERGLVLGADAYLTKPVEPQNLLATISNLLAGRGESRRAMVAASDRRALESVTRVLREQGFEVVEAYDPRGVLSTMEEVRPDLVVLDEILSQFNDAEILKALRFQDMERNCTIVVVASETHEHGDPSTVSLEEQKP